MHYHLVESASHRASHDHNVVKKNTFGNDGLPYKSGLMSEYVGYTNILNEISISINTQYISYIFIYFVNSYQL